MLEQVVTGGIERCKRIGGRGGNMITIYIYLE